MGKNLRFEMYFATYLIYAYDKWKIPRLYAPLLLHFLIVYLMLILYNLVNSVLPAPPLYRHLKVKRSS